MTKKTTKKKSKPVPWITAKETAFRRLLDLHNNFYDIDDLLSTHPLLFDGDALFTAYLQVEEALAEYAKRLYDTRRNDPE